MRSRAGGSGPAARARGYVDPSFEWARATNFAHFGNSQWCRLLLGFADAKGARAFASAHPRPVDRETEQDTDIWVPSMYINPPKVLADTTYCTAVARVGFLRTLSLRHWRSQNGIRSFELGTALDLQGNWASNFDPITSPLTLSQVSSNAVVTGIIDDGLGIANERFRIKNKTRIEWFWDQVEPNPNPSPNFDYGYQLCKYDIAGPPRIPGIDTWLGRCTHAGIVDDEEFYRRTKLVDFSSAGHKPTAQRSSHGTHVMDLACGDDPKTVKNDRPIICVQLPLRTTADTSGATLSPQVLDALWYIVGRAGSFPVVVNLSYGLFAGPHDGTGEAEKAINEVIELRSQIAPTAVVLPAGNSYLACCHAHFELKKTETRVMQWRLQPDDRTGSVLEIWLPYPGSLNPKIKVQVVTPGGIASGWVSEGGTIQFRPTAVICEVRYVAPSGPFSPGMVRITLNPTSTFDPAINVAPPGIWRVEVQNDCGRPIPDIRAWIQRDDAPHGYPVRGRQSRFEDPQYRRFVESSGRDEERDSTNPANYVKREGSINAIATGSLPVVIGGFRRRDLAMAKYSAAGPIVRRSGGSPKPRKRSTPDAAAVSEDSYACHGVLAAGTRSGSVVAISGTSIAAPQITRWLTATLVNPPEMARKLVQTLAKDQEAFPRPTPPYKPYKAKPSADRGGMGRILLPPVTKVNRDGP